MTTWWTSDSWARRLIEWFAADAHDSTKQLFADVLDASGYQLATSTEAHRLDELFDEVFAVADDLDRDQLHDRRRPTEAG